MASAWDDDPIMQAAQKAAERRTTISAEEHATILAALTFWRQCRLDDADNRPPPIQQIATNGGTLPTVTQDRLKLLIERLNGASTIMVESVHSVLGTLCSVCGEEQFATPSGSSCPNAHGGVPGFTRAETTPQMPPTQCAAYVLGCGDWAYVDDLLRRQCRGGMVFMRCDTDPTSSDRFAGLCQCACHEHERGTPSSLLSHPPGAGFRGVPRSPSPRPSERDGEPDVF